MDGADRVLCHEKRYWRGKIIIEAIENVKDGQTSDREKEIQNISGKYGIWVEVHSWQQERGTVRTVPFSGPDGYSPIQQIGNLREIDI